MQEKLRVSAKPVDIYFEISAFQKMGEFEQLKILWYFEHAVTIWATGKRRCTFLLSEPRSCDAFWEDVESSFSLVAVFKVQCAAESFLPIRLLSADHDFGQTYSLTEREIFVVFCRSWVVST